MRNVLQKGNRLYQGFDHANIRLIWLMWVEEGTMLGISQSAIESMKTPKK